MDEKLMLVIFSGENYEAHIMEIRKTNASGFLQEWLEDAESIPEGLYYFQDKYGLYVGIDNITGNGSFRAFDTNEECLDWLREVMKNEQKLVKRTGRGSSKSAGDGFDGEWFHTKSTVGSQNEFLQICKKYHWLTACNLENLTKISMANDCGWPVDHIATMIWMCTDYRESFEEEIKFKNAGMQRKKILRVLTQTQNRYAYYSRICDKLGARELMEDEKDTEAGKETES